MVCALLGKSTIHGSSLARYLIKDPLVTKPLERHPKLDGKRITSIVRIWGILVDKGERIRVLYSTEGPKTAIIAHPGLSIPIPIDPQIRS